MSMKNFGGVLDFAIQMENEDASFLQKALTNPEYSDSTDLLESFIKESKKNAKTLTRARQENVTEMILEPIQGLDPENYQFDRPDPVKMSKHDLFDKLKNMEATAEDFYQEAAERIRPVSDVAGIFQRMAKKRKKRSNQIESL